MRTFLLAASKMEAQIKQQELLDQEEEEADFNPFK